jgi:Flp pilus assembly protein TadG
MRQVAKVDMKCLKKERGSQVLELALVLPLLVFLVMLVIEGSSMLRVHQLLNNAAREGARLIVNKTFGEASNRNTMAAATVTDYLTKNKVVPSGGATFKYGQCNSWSNANVAVSSAAAETFDVPAPVLPSPSPNVTMQATRVTATCTYQFYFVPKVSFFGTQPLTVPLSGSATLLNLW